MVEPRIVVPVVAGSSPVGHPRRGFRPHLLPSGSLKGIDLLCRLNLPARIQRRLEDGTLPKKVSSKPAHTSSFGFIEAIRCRAAGPAAETRWLLRLAHWRQGLPPYKLYHQQILNRYRQLTNANSSRVING